MNGRPKHTKPDSNQSEVMADLQAMGYEVYDTHDLSGFVDFIVVGIKTGYPFPCACLVECKQEGKDLSDKQKIFWGSMKYPSVYVLAHTAEDVDKWFKSY